MNVYLLHAYVYDTSGSLCFLYVYMWHIKSVPMCAYQDIIGCPIHPINWLIIYICTLQMHYGYELSMTHIFYIPLLIKEGITE